jgi:hypothetical protein
MAEPKKKTSFRKYGTLAQANAGAVMKVNGPDGKETEDWMKVRGIDSDAFQKANRDMRRDIFSYLEEKGTDVKGTDEYLKFTFDAQRKLQASLVMDWSFEEPCTVDNVVELFTQAPYIAEQVDSFASKRSRFVSA